MTVAHNTAYYRGGVIDHPGKIAVGHNGPLLFASGQDLGCSQRLFIQAHSFLSASLITKTTAGGRSGRKGRAVVVSGKGRRRPSLLAIID
jgi:hypothetical protein